MRLETDEMAGFMYEKQKSENRRANLVPIKKRAGIVIYPGPLGGRMTDVAYRTMPCKS